MAESYNTNLNNVAACYIKALKVPVILNTLQQHITENPFYQSLFSISNALDKFPILNEPYKIEVDNIEQLTLSFIAYLKNLPTGKDFVLVTSVKKNEVSYISEQIERANNKISRKFFLEVEVAN